jgi:hypothetical protein
MVGPPSLLESLNGYSGIDVTAVWVSMQSKEQFVKQAATMVARGEGNAGTGAELVRAWYSAELFVFMPLNVYPT